MTPPLANTAYLLPVATDPPLRQLTDAALMRVVRQGNDDAFGILVERHERGLVNSLVYITGSRARAEEIAQEAFLRAYRAAHRYDEQGRFSGWLFRIATNLARTDARRRSRWLDRVDRVRNYFSLPEPVTPHAQVRGHQEQSVVRDSLTRLPDIYREAVVLREIEGWAYDHIAEALQIPVGTAKSRVHRGKAMLQRDLAAFWKEGEPA